MSTVLTKEALRNLKGQDVRTKDVPVPEWGENAVIRLCVMSGAASESFETLVQSQAPADQQEEGGSQIAATEGFRWALLSRTVVDSHNNLMFESDDEAKEIIGALNYRTIMEIIYEALDLNGLRGEGVEQAEKNSSDTPPGGTGTGSHGNGGGASRKRSRK